MHLWPPRTRRRRAHRDGASGSGRRGRSCWRARPEIASERDSRSRRGVPMPFAARMTNASARIRMRAFVRLQMSLRHPVRRIVLETQDPRAREQPDAAFDGIAHIGSVRTRSDPARTPEVAGPDMGDNVASPACRSHGRPRDRPATNASQVRPGRPRFCARGRRWSEASGHGRRGAERMGPQPQRPCRAGPSFSA